MFKESNRQKDSKGDYVPVERGRRRERLVPKWQTMSLLDLGAADSLLSGEWDDLTDAADAADVAGGVGMKTGAGGHPQPYDAHGRYTGPTGGVYDRATGEIRLLSTNGSMLAARKLAGADNEAGHGEPVSLLTATSEELDRIVTGTGQALSEGAAGARQALSRTWHELRDNEELHKGVEFGAKAAAEVSKEVAATVLEDTGYNLWDSAGAEAAERLGMENVSKTLANPGITVPINKAVGIKRIYDSVWDGGLEKDTRDLGTRIDNVFERVYGRRR